jgi:hypothetical protein
MFWRGANAAHDAGCLIEWPYLPQWHKAWIIAIAEIKTDIANM